MVVYLALVVWYFGCDLIFRRTRWLELLLDLIPTVLVIGMRNQFVGADTKMYVGVFESLKYLGQYGDYSVLDQSHYGQLFLLMTQFFGRIFSSYHSYLFILALIGVCPVAYLAYRYGLNLGLTFTTFVLINGLAGYMNIQRQALAITFGYVGVFLWLRRHRVASMLFFLGGFLLHPMVIVIAVVAIISVIPFKKIYLFMALPVGFILYFMYTPLFNIFTHFFPAYSYYSSSTAQLLYNGGAMAAMLQLFMTLVLLSVVQYACSAAKPTEDIQLPESQNATWQAHQTFMNTALWFLTVSVAFSIMVLKFSQISRIVYELNFMLVFAIPGAFKYVPKTRLRLYLLLGSVTFMFAYFVVVQVFRPEWFGIVPYSWGD